MNLRIISKQVVLLLICLWFFSCSKDITKATYMIVAHQGYWKAADGAQNSIRGLREADRLGIEGVELDVRITKDNRLILHHDAVAGNYVIAESELKAIRNLRLSDGSLIPTIEEYFEEVNKYKKLELYIDIKTTDALIATMDAIQDYGLTDRAILLLPFEMGLQAISYNRNIRVHCMNNNITPIELKENGFSGISYNKSFLKQHADLIQMAHSYGLTVGCWVVKSESEIIWCSLNNVDYVATDSPFECKYYLHQ